MSEFSKKIWVLYKMVVASTALFLLLFVFISILHFFPDFYVLHKENTQDKQPISSLAPELEFKEGIHIETGFIQGEGVDQVIITCTACHSSKMVTQNRATREGWESMIRWMQETQNLWDLGENEKIILDYLEKYYSPEKLGRRKNLEAPQWYVLQ